MRPPPHPPPLCAAGRPPWPVVVSRCGLIGTLPMPSCRAQFLCLLAVRTSSLCHVSIQILPVCIGFLMFLLLNRKCCTCPYGTSSGVCTVFSFILYLAFLRSQCLSKSRAVGFEEVSFINIFFHSSCLFRLFKKDLLVLYYDFV